MTKFSEVFKGYMRNGEYIFDECPYCGEKHTFTFIGGFSIGSCVACSNFKTYDEFIKDMSNDLIYGQAVDAMSRPSAPEGLIDIGRYVKPVQSKVDISSGFNGLDRLLGGFRGTALTILAGKRGGGKSTLAGQLALNAINSGNKVFFYSGELDAESFQEWLLLQCAGRNYINSYVDHYGKTRYDIDHDYAEPRIRRWLDGQLSLYDNSIIKTSEYNTIIERAMYAKQYYGCNLFIVDNLKTARFKNDNERDHLRKQANFTADMLAFAQHTNSHVILVAHPKKEDTGDANDNVAGLSDITDIAHNIMTIYRLSEAQEREMGCQTILDVSKNRRYGEYFKFKMDFDPESKRFYMQDSKNVERYNWETEV